MGSPNYSMELAYRSNVCCDVILNDGPYLNGLIFGPRPEDWHMDWEEAVEDFVGELWD
jgi:hypothetical protein